MADIDVSRQQGSDPAPNCESEGPQDLRSKTDEDKYSRSDGPAEPISSDKDEKVKSSSVEPSVDVIHTPGESTLPVGSLDTGADGHAFHISSYPMGHAIYYGGYENPGALWGEYSQMLHSEGRERGALATNPLVFHTGYGYGHQMSFGPYSPVATLPLVRRENPMYSSQDSPHTGPYYHQTGPTTITYLTSPSSSPSNQTSSFTPGPSTGGGNSGNPGNQYYHDTWHLFDGGFWSDWLKPPEGMRPLTPLSPVASPRAFPVGPIGHGLSPFSSPMGSPRWRQSDRGPHRHSANVVANTGVNSYGLVAADRSWPRVPVNSNLCSCAGPVDFLNEQNRGPRGAEKQRTPPQNQAATEDSNAKPEATGVDFGSYNKPDFQTDYDDARFFVIKSYSEDNVHKSIKYGVWASTSNGNRKLDSAYRESKSKDTECPVFLLFSVNASAHFCGVAEMVGPVDFEKSVDFWQQDKWNGHFPVKWHIIKDVPNSFFRHITLENNDNKPVTNSRDTQEVNLEQGVEMLNIFKDHESRISILNDFDFYEEREKAMGERKAKQRQQHQQQQMGNSEVSATQLQRTFAQAVRLDEKKSKMKDEFPVGATEGAGSANEHFPSLAEVARTKGV
ncbi:uncharacterized protein LOC144708412 [Wolffia australiana]